MRFVIRLVVLCLALIGAVYGYTFTMARVGSADAPDMGAPELRADSIFVDKTMRRLDLLKDGKVLRSYQISLGAMPAGHKTREGDERTPTGTYLIDWRNASSIAHLSLHISYPNAADQAQAAGGRRIAGGQYNDPWYCQWLGVDRRIAPKMGLDEWLHRRHQCRNARNLVDDTKRHPDHHHRMNKKTRAQGPGKSNREVHKITRLCDGIWYLYSCFP